MSRIIPAKESKFNIFVTVFTETVEAGLPRWTFNKKFFRQTYLPAYRKYKAAVTVWLVRAERSQVTAVNKNVARKELEIHLRRLIDMIRADPSVTVEDLKDLQIYVGRHTNTLLAAPSKSPLIMHLFSEDATIMLYALNRETNKRGRPKGAVAYVVVFVVADAPPKKKSEYTNRVYVSGGTFSHQFSDELRGRRVQFRVFWVNRAGEESPWSPVEEIIIP
jgi:hypothetical protein